MLALAICLCVSCGSPRRDLARAAKLEAQGRHAEALPLYERAIARTSDLTQQSDAHLKLGDCLYELRRLNEAFAAYQSAVELDGANLMARQKAAELMLAGGAPERAVAHAQYILARKSEDAGALAVLGSTEAAMGRHESAAAFYRRALDRDPSRANIAIALAETYLALGRSTEARAALLSAAVSGSKPQPWLALGRLEEQSGNNEGAEHAYRKAVGAEDSTLTTLRLAQFLQRTGRIHEAEQLLKKEEARQPLSTLVADFQLATGRTQAALLAYLKRMMGAADDVEPAIAARAIEAKLSEGTPESSGAAANLLEQYRPALPVAMATLLDAEIALAHIDLPRAEATLQTLPANASTLPVAHYLRGVLAERQGNLGQAQVEWVAAVTRDPGHVPSRLALARQLLATGAADLAEEHVATVVREEPANLRALELYTRVLIAQRRFPAALSMAFRAGTVAPDDRLGDLLRREIASAQRREAVSR